MRSETMPLPDLAPSRARNLLEPLGRVLRRALICNPMAWFALFAWLLTWVVARILGGVWPTEIYRQLGGDLPTITTFPITVLRYHWFLLAGLLLLSIPAGLWMERRPRRRYSFLWLVPLTFFFLYVLGLGVGAIALILPFYSIPKLIR